MFYLLNNPGQCSIPTLQSVESLILVDSKGRCPLNQKFSPRIHMRKNSILYSSVSLHNKHMRALHWTSSISWSFPKRHIYLDLNIIKIYLYHYTHGTLPAYQFFVCCPTPWSFRKTNTSIIIYHGCPQGNIAILVFVIVHRNNVMVCYFYDRPKVKHILGWSLKMDHKSYSYSQDINYTQNIISLDFLYVIILLLIRLLQLWQ